MKSPSLKLLAAVAALSVSGFSHAACVAPLSTSDMTYGVDYPNPPIQNATDCTLISQDNDDAALINTLGFGTGYVLGAKDNTPGSDESNQVSLFGGLFTFSLTALGVPGTEGTYLLSATDDNGGVTDPNFPLYLDFVFAVKAGNLFGAYFFDDVEFDGSGGGAWKVSFTNLNNNNTPQLSHLSAYVREGSSSSSSSTSGLASTSSGVVPEPSSNMLALLGLGLVGGSLLMRRKARKV